MPVIHGGIAIGTKPQTSNALINKVSRVCDGGCLNKITTTCPSQQDTLTIMFVLFQRRPLGHHPAPLRRQRGKTTYRTEDQTQPRGHRTGPQALQMCE